jgi:hypothetical protein
LDRIVEAQLAMLRHIGRKKRCEDFRDRTDLGQRVSVERPIVALFKGAGGDNASTVRIDDSDDDADPLPLHVDAVGEDVQDLGVGWCGAG